MKIYGPVKISKKLTNIIHAIRNKDCRLRYLYGCCRTNNPSLVSEIGNLIREYGEDYPTHILTCFNNTDLCSHIKAAEIKIDGRFQHNTHESRIQRYKHHDGIEYIRLPNPFGPDVIDGKIGAKNMDGDIVLIDVDQYVRPMLNGFVFKTPDEIMAEDKLSVYCDCVFSNIDNRVVEFIKSKSGMLDPAVSYSAYRSDQNDIPIDNLDEIAICGKCVIVEDTYQSPIVENPTWLDLCLLAEYMIRETEDYHHVFLEGVCKSDQEIDGVPVYKFCMGS